MTPMADGAAPCPAWRTWGFIATFVLSRVGDTVFLVGMPLYLYQTGGNSLLSATYVNLAIMLTVFVGRKLIVSTNAGHPILLCAVGELAMAAWEVLMLFALRAWGTMPPLVVAFVVLLALTYNLYAPAKFYRLQDHFFPQRRYLNTTILTVLSSVGVLVGVGLSGILLSRAGFEGLLVFDMATFAIFGLYMLANQSLPATPDDAPGGDSASGGAAEATMPWVPAAAITMLSFATLMSAWDQSSAIAVFSKTAALDVELVSTARAAWGLVGLALSLWASHSLARSSCGLLFAAAAAAAAAGVGAGAFLPPEAAGSLCFLALGTMTGLSVAVRRDVFQALEARGYSFAGLNARYWVYSTLVCFAVPVIAMVGDAFFNKPRLCFFLTGLCLLAVGIGVGYPVSRAVLAKGEL